MTLDDPKDLSAQSDTPVEINIGGKIYTLRYTMGTLKKLKGKFGRSMMGIKGNLLDLDEEMLPKLLVAGAYDVDGNQTLTEEMLDELPSASFTSLVQAFNAAWFGSLPKKSTDPAVQAALATLLKANQS